jgi:hypothetical protein
MSECRYLAEELWEDVLPRDQEFDRPEACI